MSHEAPHIEAYLIEIADLLLSDPSLAGHPTETVVATARVLAYRVRPIAHVLEESTDRFVFRITSPRLATLVGGCMGNDTNSDRHTGAAAITQSNALIAICTDAVMQSLKGSLITVDPLNFRNALPVEESVIVTIENINRKKLTIGTIVVVNEVTQKVILKKADLQMSPT